MAFHHLAFATQDLEATHAFYTDVMGFRLAKTVVAGTGNGDGWARHVFYDTGDGQYLAFWDLHDADVPADFNAAISEGLGLPQWVNHVAFAARDLDDLEARKQRWVDHGLVVIEVDHEWCRSVYVTDPNRILIEFCVNSRELTQAEADQALAALRDPAPVVEPPPTPIIHGLPARAPA